MIHYDLDPEYRNRFADLSLSRFDQLPTLRTLVVNGEWLDDVPAERRKPLVVEDSPRRKVPIVMPAGPPKPPVSAPGIGRVHHQPVGRPHRELDLVEIHKLRDSGLTWAAVAAKFKCGVGLIHKALRRERGGEKISRRLNVPTGTTYGNLTVVRELRQQGYSRFFLVRCKCGKELAARLNALTAGMRSCGCARQTQIERRALVIALRGEGLSTRQIQQRTGICKSTVALICRQQAAKDEEVRRG